MNETEMLEFAAQRPPDQPTRDSRGNIIARPSGTPLPKPVAYTILPGGQRYEFNLFTFYLILFSFLFFLFHCLLVDSSSSY